MRGHRAAELLCVALVVAIALIAFTYQWDKKESRTGTGDAYWYMLSAERFAGASPAEADRATATYYCGQVHRSYRLGGSDYDCTTYSVATVPQRYRHIFASRPGYPIVLAPFVAALGLPAGVRVVTLLLFLLVAVAGYAAMRLTGIGRAGSVAGAALLCLLPPAYWHSRVMAEALATLLVLLAVIAIGIMARGRHLAGGILLGAAEVALFVTKPANGAAMAVLLAGTAGLLAVLAAVRRGPLLRVWIIAAGVTAGCTLAWLGISAVLHLPGLNETVQDTATAHFATPDIADPMGYLQLRARLMWEAIPRVGRLPSPMLPVVVGCVVLVVRQKAMGLLWCAVALQGVLVATVHPLIDQYDRLVLMVWIAVVVALAALVDLAGSLERGEQSPARPADRPRTD